MCPVFHEDNFSIPGNRQRGNLFIISAPSGAGKTTLCSAICKRFPNLKYSISHTTRQPRDGEQNGVDYYFISKKEFERGIHAAKWLEWATVYGHYYGTSAEFIENNLAKGHCVLLDIDVAGTRQILERIPQSVTIFILPPSLEALRQRLEARGTDSPETIANRLKNAEEEIAQKHFYRHHLINDSLPETIDQLSEVIRSYQKKHCDTPGG
jgi:guanylate kinase